MKRLALILVLLVAVSALYGQNDANSVPRLDGVVKSVAADLHRRLAAEGARKVAVAQFVFQDGLPSLGAYWNTQLVQELAAISGRSWTLLSGPGNEADWTISGEIVEIVNVVRVYTRLIKNSDHSIANSSQSDFPRDAFIAEMLADGGSNGRSSSTPRDAYEPDSMANAVTVQIGSNEDEARVINRTIHTSGDEDFFLLVSDREGSLTIETTGDTDTFMELYDENGRKITENDDGGSGGNARIRQTVRPGPRYTAKVRGYSGETGSYGFRAYIVEEVRINPDEYEEDNSFTTAKEISVGTPQQHTFHNGDDVDFVKFTITRAGAYTIHARGVQSNRLDTYIELFNSGQRSIEADDDGGENVDSLITARLEPGTYYLKTECLDSGPDQPYTISVRGE
jgi:hypothetical protein